MSVNSLLKGVLSGIAPGPWLWKCPLERPPDEYIIYNPVIDVPQDFGDNEELEWVQHMQVHLFTKGNYIAKRKAIRKALKGAGFAINDIASLHEKGSGYFHLCFSCEIEEMEEE